MFEIWERPLEIASAVSAVAHSAAGAIDVFVGVVRDHNEGRAVTKLEYEAYAPMAQKEMARIAEEIAAGIPGVRLAVIHRVGSLAVGDAAVVCAASAAHRGEAFAACRRLIDEIKARVPIWKREWGAEGPYWVGWEDARCAPGEEHGGHGASGHGNGHGNGPDRGESAGAAVEQRAGGHSHAGHSHAGERGGGHGHAGERGGGHAHSHGHKGHGSGDSAKRDVRVVTVTVSDSRDAGSDESGRVLREGLEKAGFRVGRHVIVPDEPARIRAEIERAIDGGEADAVVSTGGTGIAPRDQTFEAVSAMLEKTLDGFGEAFRRLSWEQVGARAVLSRAVAGTYHKGVVIALPGSPKAVSLGVEQLVAAMLAHAVSLAKG